MSSSGPAGILTKGCGFLFVACLLGVWVGASRGVKADSVAVGTADVAAAGAANDAAAGSVDTVAIGRAESTQVGTADIPRHLWYESEQGPLWLGEVTRHDILTRFPGWQQEYDAYQPDPERIADLAAVATPVRVLCVLGTWCSDSQREVPRFWKLLDLAGNTHLSLQMLAVARRADAQAEQDLLASLGFTNDIRDDHDVELVPTFIFSAGGEELGRIVESPEQSLEHDAVLILADLEESPAPSRWR